MRLNTLNFSELAPDALNNLNTALMILSVTGAMFFPFELFLFSFLILGPLHYLTEVSWLQKRNFFIRHKWDAFFLIGLCVIMTLLMVFPVKKSHLFITNLVFIGFVFALIVMLVNQVWLKIGLMAMVGCIMFFSGIHKASWFIVIFGIFMTTIIHTTVFTGVFILSGITKRKSVSGIISLLMFILCSVFFFVWPFELPVYVVSAYAKEAFGFFVIVNKTISDFFQFGHFTKLDDVFYSREGLIIIRFVAFAYTYHYLNWFTKTSVIKWHEVSRLRMLFIIFIWVMLTGLYLYDLKKGLMAAYIFAMLHTLLEFPLNHHAFLAMFKK